MPVQPRFGVPRKIDDPKINRSIEQSMEIDDLKINQSIDTIEKLLTE